MGKQKTPEKVSSAMNKYEAAVLNNTGTSGFNRVRAHTQGTGSEMANENLNSGLSGANRITKSVNNAGASGANSQMANINANARQYAGQQAQAAAAGAQSQATTAARAAGMNKAQAAVMGSQQNANAYQNAYGNAYGQQLGTANSAFENNANRMNSNINNQQQLANSNQLNQQQLYASMLGANVTGYGNQVSMLQGQDAQNYQQGGLFSDERLKHYKECSKKVVVRSPSKIKALKITTKGK
jgi:hypothetical protein